MKTKRLFMVFLSVLMVVSLSLFAFACKEDKEPTPLTIDSVSESTIEIGEEYTLLYTSTGEVTVTASGGTYNAETKKFTATEAGDYVLTVTALEEGKAETSKEVKVKVVAGADKSALNEAIAKANKLTSSDYTVASWQAMTAAKGVASQLLTKFGESQDTVNAAAAELQAKITALVPADIEKAVVEGENLVNGNDTFFAADYENMAEVLEKVTELNADESVKLRSEYANKIQAIIATLVAKPSLKVTGAPNGVMLVSELVSYEITAEAEEGAKLEWKLNGAAVTTGLSEDGKKLTYTPAAFGETYKIEVTATVGEGESAKTRTVTYEGSFLKTAYTVNNNKLTVDDNVISSEQTGWGDSKGTKVVLSDLRFSGDVTVYFDLVFEQIGAPAVMGIFFLNANGESIDNWAVVSAADGFIEVATVDDTAKKVRVNSPTTEMNKTYHFMATRSIKDGKGYLTMAMLDDNGNVLVFNGGKDIAKDYTGPVMIGIQTENTKGKIFNISVAKDTEVCDKTELATLVDEVKLLDASDYNTEIRLEFTLALAKANSALNSNAATKTDIDSAVEALKAVKAKLIPANYAPVVKAEIITDEGDAETGFEFGGKEYTVADYTNIAAILVEVKALNENTEIVRNSEYKAEIAKIIAKLTPAVDIQSSNADLEKAMLVSEFEELVFNAVSSDDATFAWTLNGEAAGTGAQFKFTPDHNGEYTIEVTATDGDKTNSKEVTVSVHKLSYAVNTKFVDGIKVEDGVIKVTNGYGWGDQEGKKVTIPDIAVTGDFDVTFNLKFTEHRGDAGNANVFALFFNNADGNNNVNWVAVCQHSGKLEVARGGDGPQKPQTDLFKVPFTFDEETGNPVEPVDTTEGAENNDALKAGSFEVGKVWTIKIERRIRNGKAFTVAYIFDENDNLVAYNNRDEGKEYTGAIKFGFQSENVSFEVSNFVVENINATVVDRTELGLAVNEANKLILSDFVDTKEFVEALLAARDTYKSTTTQKNYDKALAELTAAIEALELKPIEKAEVLTSSFGYNGISYEANSYTNFIVVAGKIAVLNENADIKTVSEYDAAVKAIIAELVTKFDVAVSGITEGNLIVNELATYNLTAEAKAKEAAAEEGETQTPAYTWKWAVNGVEVEEATQATFAFLPEEFGAYTVTATATADGTSVSKTVNVSFIQANFIGRALNDDNTVVENNSFKLPAGIGWGHYEGRNAMLDDLAFNGSFSVTVDATIDEKGGGAQVLTMHLLNTDTLSPNFGGDWANISYGCICLHENPVRLESGAGIGKKQSSDGGFEAVAAKMKVMTDRGDFEQGKTITIKLTTLRNTERQYTIIFSVWDSVAGEWVDFARPTEWVGDFSGAFTVTHNVENTGVTLSNYRYELLEATDTYVAGSVQSKVALHKALDTYAAFDASEYLNADEFLTVYEKAKKEFFNNRITADYEAVRVELEAAHKALVERTVKAGVAELDKGFKTLRGITSLTVTGEDVTVENVSWSYKFLAAGASKDTEPEAKTATGATLTLANGKYSEVKVTVGEEVISYQDFAVEAVNLKSNTGKITLSEDKTVATVKGGDGWGAKEQLVLDGLWGNEFELTFKAAAHIAANGGDYRIFGINLYGDKVREVFGVRQGNHNRFQYGPDGNLGEVFKDSDEATFNAIYGDGKTDADWGTESDNAFTYSLKVTKVDFAKYSVTFTVYKADGSVYVSKTTEHSLFHNDSTTALYFYFENMDMQLSDFTVMCK